MAQLQTVTIDKFLGVNKSDTETLLMLGEASESSNWIITDDNKLVKMYGYKRLFESLGAHKINGMWYGSILGVSHFIFACNGHVYEHNLSTNTNIDLGVIVDSYPTTIFANNNTVYIMDGTEYYKWTGTGSISVVAGYTPVVATASPPTGGGTLFEPINYLSGKKKQIFNANGSATVYQMLETGIASIDEVKVNGIVRTDYTPNLSAGTAAFTSAPPTGEKNVEITWTKANAVNRALITNNRYYGGVYYSRLWLYGNPNHKNTRYVSGITLAGSSDPEYWPVYADSDIGEYEITGITTQYDKQLIFTSGDSSEASAWYSTNETYVDNNSGIVNTVFPVFPINAKIGNIAPGQIQIILNNPFTLWKGVYQWVATYVVNEKNAQWMSQRIQNDLDTVDLSRAITIDWNEKGQYWLCVGKRVWVYSYRVDAWYILDLPHTPTCFLAVDGKLCFGTDDGRIMRFDTSIATFDGITIKAIWKMGFYNFGVEWLRKFIQRIFVTILPLTTTHVDITYETDRRNANDTYTAKYGLSGFDTWDFSNFSFSTNYSPQPFKFKVRAKKIDYFKLILKNEGTDGVTVLSITIPERTSGEIKNRS